MGINEELFKSRDKLTNQTIMPPSRFMFGGSSDGKSVTEQTAVQMIDVNSCVCVLSEAVEGLLLHFYQYRDTWW